MSGRDKLKSLFKKALSAFDVKDVKKERPLTSRQPNIQEIKQEFLRAKQKLSEDQAKRRTSEIEKAARNLLREHHTFELTPPGLDRKPKTKKIMEQAEHIVEHDHIQEVTATEQAYAHQVQNHHANDQATPSLETSEGSNLSGASLSGTFNFAGHEGANHSRER